MSKIDTWQSLEDEVQKRLVYLQRKHSLFFQRFYDTKSAGSYIPAQPSDFLALFNARAVYIEAKFSGVEDSLRSVFSGAVSDGQLASARLIKRAGGHYFILFHSSTSGLFEIWPGPYCAEQRSRSKPLELARRTLLKDLNEAIDYVLQADSYDTDEDC